MKRRIFLQNLSLGSAAAALPATNLLAAPAKKPLFRVGHITDIHVNTGEIREKGMALALNHLAKQKPAVDFIINTGDAIDDALAADKQKTAEQIKLYQTILGKENRLPIYHTIGNHDIWGWFIKNPQNENQDKLYGKQWAVEAYQMPGRYYSFKRGPWHFLVLDSTQLNPAGGYIAYFDDPQYEWLVGELQKIPANEYVCIVSHIPILSICAGLFFDKNEPNGDLKIQRNLMHTDFFKLRKLFLNHPQVRVCISGHIHLVDEVKYLGVQYYCSGAVSGNWWRGAFHDHEPAYSVLEFFADGRCERRMVKYGMEA